MNSITSSVHIPILVGTIVESLVESFSKLPESAPPHWIVDCTLGGGGHTSAFLEALAKNPALARHRVLALDRDPSAIARAGVRFKDQIREGKLELCHLRFGSAKEIVAGRPVLGLLADLGFSSDQMDDPTRGLSFHSDKALDMRLDSSDSSTEMTCYEYLNQVSEIELERVLREYGEERFSKRIASSIIRSRFEDQLPTTPQELVKVIVRALPPNARHGRIHVATRSFQALRIAVNNELSELDSLLEKVIDWICPGGRVAILSFHSLEDRRVKHKFKQSESFRSLTKKPIEASDDEVKSNPRARSAKLRIAERVRC